MSSLEDRIQRIQDEQAIRKLVARFANSFSPPNYDAFSKLWVPGGEGQQPVWTLNEPFTMSASGIDEIMDMLVKLLKPRDFFVQLVHSGMIEIDGDHATGRWILREVAKGPGETYYNNFAIYEDVMKKVEGSWYFARRDYKYMFMDTSSFEGQVFSL